MELIIVTPTNEFLGMPPRRNPNNTYADQDKDTIDFHRSSKLMERSEVLSRRLMNEKQRTIGIDINALNEQIKDTNTNMHNIDKQTRAEHCKIRASVDAHIEAERWSESQRRRAAREYAAFLETQCLEKQTKRTEQVDLDPKYTIGYHPHPRDDGAMRRADMVRYRDELREQMETKVRVISPPLEVSVTPMRDSLKLSQYRERVKKDFVDGNRRMLDQRQQQCDAHESVEAVTLPQSKPHSEATDFKGYSKEHTKRILGENDQLIVWKKATMNADEQSDLFDRISLEKAVANEKLTAQKLRDQKREAQKQCLVVSAVNAQIRDQKTPQTLSNEYFINRFGNSLIYSLLE